MGFLAAFDLSLLINKSRSELIREVIAAYAA